MFDIRPAKQALLRLVVALAAIVGAVQLVRLLLLPAIQSVFHPGDAMTSVLRRTGIFLFAILAYWAYVRLFEKRRASELRIAPLPIALGAISGCGGSRHTEGRNIQRFNRRFYWLCHLRHPFVRHSVCAVGHVHGHMFPPVR